MKENEGRKRGGVHRETLAAQEDHWESFVTCRWGQEQHRPHPEVLGTKSISLKQSSKAKA